MGTSRSSSRPRARQTPDLNLLLRLMQKFKISPAPAIAQQRRLVADLCKWLGAQLDPNAAAAASGAARDRHRGQAAPAPPVPSPALSPRMRQTLQCLLAGDSEKQIANRLHLSPNTVHVYVKALYERHSVSSRGELLARFIPRETPGDRPDVLGPDPVMTGHSSRRDSNDAATAKGKAIRDGAANTDAHRAEPDPLLRRGGTSLPHAPTGNSHDGLGGLTKED